MFFFKKKAPQKIEPAVTASFEKTIEEIKNLPSPSTNPVDWNALSSHTAWFDHPDAMLYIQEEIQHGNVSKSDAKLLEKWVTDGYMVLEKAVPEEDIDEVNRFVDNLLSTDMPNENITLLGYTLDKNKGGDAVPHKDLLTLAPEDRLAQARLTPWRIHELWTQCAAAERIYKNKRLNDMATLIFGRPAYPRSTINFYLGSKQELHQDMAVFHVFPGNYLIGAWIALEDISADSGPLRYVPNTHTSKQYHKFDNHPQTTLRTCALDEYAGYYDYMNAEAERNGGAKSFIAKKGDVFLWHGKLIHGGSPVNNPELTRKSMVIHYLTDGTDQTDKIVGPFNWN